jgi:hypothetical protein
LIRTPRRPPSPLLICGCPWDHPKPPQPSNAPRAPAPPHRRLAWSSHRHRTSPAPPPQFALAITSSGPLTSARPSPPVYATDRGTRSSAAHPKASFHERRPPFTAAGKTLPADRSLLCLTPVLRPSVDSWGRVGAALCQAWLKPEPEPQPRCSPATSAAPRRHRSRTVSASRAESLGVLAVSLWPS